MLKQEEAVSQDCHDVENRFLLLQEVDKAGIPSMQGHIVLCYVHICWAQEKVDWILALLWGFFLHGLC